MAANDGGRAPRAVIHKRILDSAESEPDASLERLASSVAGASPDLVERVLEQYGDPGEPAPGDAANTDEPARADAANTDESAPTDATNTDESAMSIPEPTGDTVALTEKQLATLAAIAERPDATQAELAEALDVSAATVNRRLNAIEGFDWTDRAAVVERVLGPEPAGSPSEPADDGDEDSEDPVAEDALTAEDPAAEGESTAEQPAAEPATPPPAASDGGQLVGPDAADAVEQLQERVDRLERQLGESVDPDTGPALDATLLTKVVRAVMADDDIDAAEEELVVEALR